MVSFADRYTLLESKAKPGRREEVEIQGLRFTVLPGVFPPSVFESTRVFASLLAPFYRDYFFEVGCGCGAISVLAALGGAGHVFASDVSFRAAVNAELNVRRYDLGQRISVSVCDVLSIYNGVFADVVFWNSPWCFLDCFPEGIDIELARCIGDPGYGAINSFLGEGGRVMKKGGSLLVGFGGFGDRERVIAIAHQHHLRLAGFTSRQGDLEPTVTFELFEFQPVR